MDLRGKRIEEGYTNLVTVEGDSVASSGKLQNGQGTDLGNVAVGGLSFNSGDSELQLPAGTTAERPVSPSAGYARFNTDKDKVEIFTGASWLSIALEGAVQLEAATATVTGQDAVAELSGFISQFGTPASAFSVRQLGDTDVAMRVRRSSDNAEQNIGFTSDGDLDESALTTFVGANDGFVTAWYDQSVDNSTLPAEHGSGATASYSLRKVNSSYTGDAIRVRRASDNTEQDIGFDANGELDTSALDTFVYGATALPADQGSGATASYSLRKVASAYTGDAIRVRRSSDNTEQDIGFVDGELDTSTLETFCSGTNGFVTTWYDQSGSNNATQATAGSQPQIVSSGTTIKENGKPAVQFDGTDDILDTGISSFTTTFEFSAVFNFGDVINSNNGQGEGIYGQWNSSANDFFFRHQSVAFQLGSDDSERLDFGTVSANTSYISFTSHGSSTNILRINGQQLGTATGSSFTYSSGNNLVIGNISHPFDAYLSGVVQELIYFDSDQSSNRQDIEHNQALFYGISLDGGKEAFVTTWYDQSGSNNATQSTAGSQPKIYDGTTIKENGKPAIENATHLDISTISGCTDAFIVHDVTSGDEISFGMTGNSDNDFLYIADGDSSVTEINRGIGSPEYYVDGVQQSWSTRSDVESALNTQTILSIIGGSLEQLDKIGQRSGDTLTNPTLYQEVILYNTDQSSNRESIELNQASYYDIGVSIGATQATAGSQPKIVSSGSVIKENNQPALDFDGSDELATDIKTNGDGDYTFHLVVNPQGANESFHAIINENDNTNDSYGLALFYHTDNAQQIFTFGHYQNVASDFDAVGSSQKPRNNQYLLTAIRDVSSDHELFVDGVSQGTTATDATIASSNNLRIGDDYRAESDRRFDGTMQEIIFYRADKSADRTDIESDIATYYNITI